MKIFILLDMIKNNINRQKQILKTNLLIFFVLYLVIPLLQQVKSENISIM